MQALTNPAKLFRRDHRRQQAPWVAAPAGHGVASVALAMPAALTGACPYAVPLSWCALAPGCPFGGPSGTSLRSPLPGHSGPFVGLLGAWPGEIINHRINHRVFHISGWHLAVGDFLAGAVIAPAGDQGLTKLQCFLASLHPPCSFAPRVSAGSAGSAVSACSACMVVAPGTIGPSIKIPLPRRATAIKPVSTPAGTSNAEPLKVPLLAIEPVTVPSLNAAAVSTEGSRRTPYACGLRSCG